MKEAKYVALQGLERHPDEAILHFNLACFHSLLCEFPEAKKHLNQANKLDEMFKAGAVDDEDLAGARRRTPL